jgi:sugar/nucleoside kinase (ribokinase family)
MMQNNLFEKTEPKPKIIGAGLIALDVIINGDDEGKPQLRTGGSCGNVLTILSYLGWQSYPIARFNEDETAKMIINDMKKWGVETSLITQSQSGSSPIIVEKIKKKQNGEPAHRFFWKCPCCGSLLPRYQPVLAKDTPPIIEKMPNASVFYFDRVSRSSIELAKENKKRGALVFFEPCVIKDKKLFLECLELADIVKYSHENGVKAQKILQKVDIPLEIKTLGPEGLRFHFKKFGSGKVKRGHMKAYTVHGLIDTAGAGDWCSAGIIHLLGRGGTKIFETLDESAINDAIRFGQALAAISCQFEGPRGIMYSISKTLFQALVNDISNKGRTLEPIEEQRCEKSSPKMVYYCPACHRHLANSK